MNDKLLSIDMSDGRVHANYSERLVTLFREVRQLTAMGVKIPPKIRTAAENALKFYRYGMTLKQVADFHNNFMNQMIRCQAPMLMDAAVKLETAINAKANITWSNTAQVETYIESIKQAETRLVNENRKLKKLHQVISDRVCQLMLTDLLKKPEEWKEGVKDIRNIIDSFTTKGYDTLQWKIHWDHQLFKALEYQYRLGLESLNENTSEFHVELVYKNHQLGFKPPFEEIRAKYYGLMKKFIKFPQNFGGIGGDSTIFNQMTERNPQSVFVVYKKAEDLFSRLLEEQEQFVEWVALGSVDIEKYVEENVTEISEWELNFKALKARGREAEKLPMEKKIDCIRISFGPVRAAIDDMMQRLADALINSVKNAVNKHISDIQNFVNTAIEALSKKPNSVEEIGESNSIRKQYAEEKGGVRAIFDHAEAKNKFLRSVAGAGVNMAITQNMWEKFEAMMEYQEAMVKEQLLNLKKGVEDHTISFNLELTKFSTRWQEIKPVKVAVQDRDVAMATVNSMKEIRAEFNEMKKEMETILKDCKSFDMEIPIFPNFETIDEEIQSYEESWSYYATFTEEFRQLQEESWLSFRNKLFTFEDFLTAWNDKLKVLGKDTVALYLRTEIDKYRNVYPSLKFVRGDVLTPDHWHELFKMLGMPRNVVPSDLTLGSFLSVGESIIQHADAIKELNNRAQGEITIREALGELKAWALEAEFSLLEYAENGKKTSLIKDWKELMTQVGDNQSLLASLKDSPYFKLFADEANIWEYKLGGLDEYLHKLNNIQRKWLYLEPIFGRGALPQEQQRFNKVDQEFRSIMAFVEVEKKVVALVDYRDIRDTLTMLLDQLERCQKALNEFLEQKRQSFPRFYFIGDDDLLEILGQAQNPQVIQTHLKKLFQGINRVDFGDKKQIIAMRSSVGEVVKFNTPVQITQYVEEWLSKLAAEMKATLKQLLVQCVELNDITAFPSQILQTAEEIHFTQRCEVALQKGLLKNLYAELQDQLSKYTSYDPGNDQITRIKLKALVLDIIHDMNIVEQLMACNVTNLNDWLWRKQCRFYFDERKTCRMRMFDAEFEYTYEYQGNAPKLVHTPLTDKCYLVLTQGMMNGYGGNPYGPAGTGKTESVKALGQLFGRQVLVFNCDEGIDFKSMGRIFTGIVKCGAWGCFDEFNRLDEEVLSAVSQQIQVIQTALKGKHPSLNLLGNTINVDANAGIFVTLNPAGKGYGGRSKLPDNLKQLFRSVAMSVPDLDQISEVILYSEGIKRARELGMKLVSIFKLSKQLLSPQQHYDWGLRPLKAILNTCGQILQNEKKKGTVIDDVTEAKLVVQALRINTLSKLTYEDSKRFNALVVDVFPGLEMSDVSYEDLEVAIKQCIESLKLEFMEGQFRKILQFHEACNQRMGVLIVGPGGSGKSTLWRVLKEALTKMKRKIMQHTMNPKAIPRSQLLGHMDMDTREWFDGVLTQAARSVVREAAEVHSWIICDGDVDPEWIESLNSVLDDNRLLTLPSGERIQFGSNVNFIFETHSLKWASPATVSRMGMIFLADEDMDTNAQIASWVKQQPEDMQSKLSKLIESYFNRAVQWILQENSPMVETTKGGLVMTGLSQLVGCSTKGEFVNALIRGLGSNLDIEKRSAFAREVFAWTGERPVDTKKPLYSYYDHKTGTFRSYDLDVIMEVKPYQLMSEPVIPTVEVRSNADSIMSWLHRGDPLLVVGPEGAGKSVLLKYCFTQLKSTSFTVLHCNSQTTAQHVIQKLNQACGIFSSSKGRVYRPKEGEHLVFYLKDINLPKPDKYDTIQLIAFLQQLITYNGFYDDNLEWIGLERVQIVATMNPATTVGRYPLTTRFTALMRIFYIAYPPREQLQAIYGIYLDAALSMLEDHATWKIKQNRQKLATCMVDIYEQVRAKFPADEYSHYLCTPRDITKWIMGLLRYDMETQDLLEVWCNEAQRLFRDKAVDTPTRQRFDKILEGVLKSQWNAKITFNYFTTATSVADKHGKKLQKISADDFKEVVGRAVVGYERENKDLNILIFPEVLDHIARIERTLSMFGGHIMLVGKSGVGRRSALVLASYMCGIPVFTPNMPRGYSIKNYKADIKQVLQLAGVEGKHVVFLMEDHQFVEPEFIEYLNSLLSSGEVPGLYAPEEIDPLLSPLKDKLSEQGYAGSLFSFFVERVKSFLHIVISMDPSNEQFNMRCESNPALYNKCNIQWWESWTMEGMQQVPLALLTRVFEDMPKKEDIVKGMLYMHETCVKAFAATPKQYITLLDNYKRIYESKKETAVEQQGRLKAGLSKLSEAAGVVDMLSREAEEKKILLAKKQEEANQTIGEITRNMDMATEQKREIKTLNEKLEVDKMQAEARKAEIESKLSKIQPMLDMAREAVGSIKSENLTEIKALKSPPEAIQHVLSGVLRLMGQKSDTWNDMKAFLGQRGVKEQILGFDAHKIAPETRQNVENLLRKESNSFEEATIAKASKAAAPLAAWVKANVQYATVLESIAPMESDLAKLKTKLESFQKKVDKLQQESQVLDEKVAHLTTEFSNRTTEAAELKMELDKAEKTLQAAQSLLSKLGGERERWDKTVKDISKDLESLPSNSLLAAGFATYLGGSPEDIRRSMIEDWSEKLGLGKNWAFKSFMSTESELLILKAEGLPADDLSMENSVILLNSVVVPFIIDPATQATEWLKNHLKNKKLEVTTQEDERFNNTLELAVRFGKTLIIQEVDKIHPILYPLLRKDLLKQGPRFVIQVGDKIVDFHAEFQMFLITRNASPVIPPDAIPLISVINFSTTRSGLEGQLLGLTIKCEKPELESKKTQLLLTEEEQKVQIAALEKELLVELAASKGNLLENTALIESLNNTKSKSLIIADSLKQSKELQLSIDKEREAYRRIAVSGAALFFVVTDLKKVSRMYQFSLPVFLKLFQKALVREDKDPPQPTVESRINHVVEKLQRLVFEYVSRALFKADRLMFALHLVHTMYPKLFGEQEWELFVGKIVMGIEKATADFPSWAAAERKPAFGLLQATLPKVIQALSLKDSEAWTGWANSPRCEAEFPAKYGKRISPFQQLLLIQALRPDRLETAMIQFVCEAMKMQSLAPPSFNFQKLFQEETIPDEPVLLIISPGADPSQELEEFALRTVGRDHFHQVAMGQGQAEIAMAALKKGYTEGHWVCLKNVHLAISWLPTLEKELAAMQPHENFRLWMTTEPHLKFSTILLQTSLKITFEAPPGIKKNLQRTYENWAPEYLAKGTIPRAQTLFALAWFHAIIQERRTFIPQGWTKFYEFGFPDLRASAEILDLMYANPSVAPDWTAVHGLLENAIYGGRVDNEYDTRILRTYLTQYFNSEMFGKQPSKRLARTIALPNSTSYDSYVDMINQMPDIDSPSLFSLPDNIDRTLQRINSGKVISLLKVLSAAVDSGARFNREKWSMELAPLLQLWSKLISSNQNLLEGKLPASRPDATPVEIFVYLENNKAHSIVKKVNGIIQAITKVIQGNGMLTPQLASIGNALLASTVPQSWLDDWEGPEDPFAWLRGLVSRTIALDSWVERVTGGSLLSSKLDLSELFRPEILLNALRQQTARLTRVPVDNLKLVAGPEPKSLVNCRLPVTVSGMLLQGCGFEGGRLSESHPDAPSFIPISSYCLGWVSTTDPEPFPEGNVVPTPVYLSSTREKLITEIKLPCTGEKAKWILTGIAICLSE